MESNWTMFEGDSSVMVKSSLEPVGKIRDEKDNRPVPPNSKAKPDGKGTTSKTMGNRDEGSSDKRSKIPCRWRNCRNPSCGWWHPPVCQNCKTEIGCKYGYKSIFDTLSLKRGSVRSRRKGVRKDQLLYCWNLYDCIVYLRILIQGSLFHGRRIR